MTTVVETLDRIARQCSVTGPTSWITATRDTHVEIRDDFLQETVSDILDRLDLPGPIGKSTTLVGGAGTTNADGSETFSLPTDFLRMQRGELAVYDQQQDRPAVPVSEDGQWSYLTDLGAAGVVKYYRTRGYEGAYEVDVYDALGTGRELTVHYIADAWMATSAGVVGNMLTAEGDVLILPRRVVEAGTVWRFRERRGLPYQDKYNETELLMSRLSNDSRNRRVVNMGGREQTVRWQDLVPDFIPSS